MDDGYYSPYPYWEDDGKETLSECKRRRRMGRRNLNNGTCRARSCSRGNAKRCRPKRGNPDVLVESRKFVSLRGRRKPPFPSSPILAVAAMHGTAIARHKAAHHEPAVAAMHATAVMHGDGHRAGVHGGHQWQAPYASPARSRGDKSRSRSGGHATCNRLTNVNSINVTIAHYY